MVEHSTADREVPGSNPGTPSTFSSFVGACNHSYAPVYLEKLVCLYVCLFQYMYRIDTKPEGTMPHNNPEGNRGCCVALFPRGRCLSGLDHIRSTRWVGKLLDCL